MEIENEDANLPQTKDDIEKQISNVVDRARNLSISIKDDESYKVAGEFLKTIKGWQKRVDEYFKPLIDRTYAAWKSAVTMRIDQYKPLETAESMLKESRSIYFETEKRKAMEQAEIARRVAHKQAEEEQIKQAETFARSGNQAGAEAILAQPTVIAPTENSPILAEAGVSHRELWSVTVTDLKALVAAVAAGTVPLCTLMANEKELNRLAKSLKKEMDYPGVTVNCKLIESVRAA